MFHACFQIEINQQKLFHVAFRHPLQNTSCNPLLVSRPRNQSCLHVHMNGLHQVYTVLNGGLMHA